MQATGNAENHQGVHGYQIAECYRLLEAADGRWTLVGYEDRLLGHAVGVTTAKVDTLMEGGRLAATIYRIDRYYPEHGQAILVLQGALMSRVFGPNYLFYAGDRSPAYAERLSLKNVRLAAIHAAPKGLSPADAALFLRSFS